MLTLAEYKYGSSILTALKKLGAKTPYAQIASRAVFEIRESLLDQYLVGDHLRDPEGRIIAAELIGRSIISAQTEQFNSESV